MAGGGGVGKNHVKVKGGSAKIKHGIFYIAPAKNWLLFSDLIFSVVTPKA